MTRQQTEKLNSAFEMADVADAPIGLIRHLVRSRPLRNAAHLRQHRAEILALR